MSDRDRGPRPTVVLSALRFPHHLVSSVVLTPRRDERPTGEKTEGDSKHRTEMGNEDRKVMPGERSSSGSSAHIVVPLGRSPGPTVLPSDSRLTAHILRTPGTRGTREATTEGTE